MTRGQESDPHRIMLEAFELRLRKQFPNSVISLGKKIKLVGLKPDVYIEHPDGSKWVYEMVYRNGHAQHILDNHQRYKQAGILDFWILWDTLAPVAPPFPKKQGVFSEFTNALKQAKSTKMLSAIASIHAQHVDGGKSLLYAFSLNELDKHIENPHLVMQIISTGVSVYSIKQFDPDGEFFQYVSDYVPLMELGFGTDGTIVLGKNQNDDLDIELLKAIGMDEQAEHFPTQMLQNLNQSIFATSENSQSALLTVYAQKIWQDATPEEIRELEEFTKAGGGSKLKSLITPKGSLAGPTASLENPEGLIAIAQYLSYLQKSIEQAEIPALVKKLLLISLRPDQWKDLSEMASWRENSDAIKRLESK